MRKAGADGRLLDWGWFLAWAIASSACCLGAAGRLGMTYDEPVYVLRGLESWRTGSNRALMKLGTMPLPVDVCTLPLYLYERWQGAPLDAVSDLERLLPWARAGTLVFWWLLLAYGWRTGRVLAGPWGGRLAVALLACEPSLLSHASLATTDVAVSACLLALVYHFRMGRGSGWLRRVGVPSVWLAATVLAKASGLVFGPICLVAVELERLLAVGGLSSGAALLGPRVGPRGWRQRLGQALGPWLPFRRDAFQIGMLGLALVFLYAGSDWQQEPTFVAWARRLPAGRLGEGMTWIAEHLRIFSNAGEGLVKQFTHNCRGHGVYLLGHGAPRAVWYYFPVALAIKLSVPLLALPLLVAALRPRVLANWACWASAALLLFTLVCRVQIGIRLVLPLVVLVVVGLAAAAVRAWRESGSGWRRRLLGGAVAASVAWTTLDAAAVWPHGLCYTNELWGGTSGGYLCLSDSNYDWGQGLKELAHWQQGRGLPPLDVWYFGTDPALRTLPMRPLPLESLPIKRPADVVAAVGGHYLAVSMTYLYGVYDRTDAHRVTAAFLRGCQPVDRTQTFRIYDFRESRADGNRASRE